MKGVYVLIIQLKCDIDTDIGALGNRPFSKGLYAYVGSAQNSLETRIKRHYSRKKRKFWHIDYLLDNSNTKITKTYIANADKLQECKTAELLNRAGYPEKGFGSSDCRCSSHLAKVTSCELPNPLRAIFTLYSNDS